MRIYLFSLILISFSFSQDNIYELYEVPQFKSKVFSISGDDVFNLKKQGDSSSFSFNLTGNYSVMDQSPLYTLSYGLNSSISSLKQPGDSTSVTNIIMSVPFSGSKYLTDDYLGVHSFFNGAFDLSMEGDNTTNPLDLLVGFGFGRITSARSVAQAVAVSDILEANLNNTEIIEMSNIIGKHSSGYYDNQYKNDADIFYYNDLAEIVKANQIMKLQQILSNPAYSNIGARYTGWQARVGYKNILLEDNGSGELVLSGAYAKPIKRDRQLYFSTDINLGLDSGVAHSAQLYGSYSIDHSYTWGTKLESIVDFTIPDDASLYYSILNLNLSTTKIILNKFSSTGEMKLIKSGNNNDAYIEINAMFTYFIF